MLFTIRQRVEGKQCRVHAGKNNKLEASGLCLSGIAIHTIAGNLKSEKNNFQLIDKIPLNIKRIKEYQKTCVRNYLARKTADNAPDVLSGTLIFSQ